MHSAPGAALLFLLVGFLFVLLVGLYLLWDERRRRK